MHPSWATCSQTPFALQGSVVQGLRSSQSAAVVHGTQSAMVAYAQASASQESVVQALPSSQSAAGEHAGPRMHRGPLSGQKVSGCTTTADDAAAGAVASAAASGWRHAARPFTPHGE